MCLIISLVTFAACQREVGGVDGDCAHTDIKRLLNKFKLIDKHTESQMLQLSAAADGNYRHVLCSNQRSSRHLVKQFAGQMQPNQSRQRTPHAACCMPHCASAANPLSASGPVWPGLVWLCPQRNGTERVCSADFVAFFRQLFVFFFLCLPP